MIAELNDAIPRGTSVRKLRALRDHVMKDPLTGAMVRGMKLAPKIGPIVRRVIDGVDELTPDQGDELLDALSAIVLSLKSDELPELVDPPTTTNEGHDATCHEEEVDHELASSHRLDGHEDAD